MIEAVKLRDLFPGHLLAGKSHACPAAVSSSVTGTRKSVAASLPVHPEALGWECQQVRSPVWVLQGKVEAVAWGNTENRRQGTQPGDTPAPPIQPRSKTIKEESTRPGR